MLCAAEVAFNPGGFMDATVFKHGKDQDQTYPKMLSWWWQIFHATQDVCVLKCKKGFIKYCLQLLWTTNLFESNWDPVFALWNFCGTWYDLIEVIQHDSALGLDTARIQSTPLGSARRFLVELWAKFWFKSLSNGDQVDFEHSVAKLSVSKSKLVYNLCIKGINWSNEKSTTSPRYPMSKVKESGWKARLVTCSPVNVKVLHLHRSQEIAHEISIWLARSAHASWCSCVVSGVQEQVRNNSLGEYIENPKQAHLIQRQGLICIMTSDSSTLWQDHIQFHGLNSEVRWKKSKDLLEIWLEDTEKKPQPGTLKPVLFLAAAMLAIIFLCFGIAVAQAPQTGPFPAKN